MMEKYIDEMFSSYDENKLEKDRIKVLESIENYIDFCYRNIKIYEITVSKNLKNTARHNLNEAINKFYTIGHNFIYLLSKYKSPEEIREQLLKILTSKNKDYDNSFEKVLQKTEERNMVTRIYDKYFRVYNMLAKRNKNMINEKIEDTMIDAIGYCILCINRIHFLLNSL